MIKTGKSHNLFTSKISIMHTRITVGHRYQIPVRIIVLAIMIGLLCQCKEEQEMGWHASGRGGAVAAGGKKAAAAGISILRQGGNAADAAAATLLALSISDYGKYAIGAEIPLIFFDNADKKVKVLSGLGSAPLDTSAINWYYKHGIPHGEMKSAPVPGAFGLCVVTVKRFGTMRFEEVVTPSLEIIDAGIEKHGKLSEAQKDSLINKSEGLQAVRARFYLEGTADALANTFRKLIKTEKETAGKREDKLQAVFDRYYKGDIAETLVDYYIKNGGFLRQRDLASYKVHMEEPVQVEYRGYTIYKCNTWTQGPYLCQTLRLLEGFDLKKMGHLSSDYIHVLTEALKLGLADRDTYYGDPRFVDVPIDALLSDQYTQLRRPLIDMHKASMDIRPGDPVNMKALKDGGVYRPGNGGTTTCVVADRWGNMVAATPSGNRPYSVCQELGIAHGNRLRSLNTTPGHPNRIQPGKRPRITLTPTIVTKDNKPVLAISVAGGDKQDQTTLNCLLNFIEFGMLPKDAVTQPRFRTKHHQHSFKPTPDRKEAIVEKGNLVLNEHIPDSVRDVLENRGHIISTISGHIADPVMIYRDGESEIIYAAGDPRAYRHADALK